MKKEKKKCCFTKKKNINFSNENLLKEYINDYGKIIPRRITGIKKKFQKKIAKNIKIARFLAIFSYISNNTTKIG